jgi:peptide/nickel transport system ATP-binding protein
MTRNLFVLDKGTIAASGPTRELLTEMQHPVLEKIMTSYHEANRVALNAGNIELKLPILQAKGISKTYYGSRSTVIANKNITLDIRAGEFIALIGVSGSGKSTLGLILCGLLEQDIGVIASANATARKKGRKEGARFVQMIFQDPYASLYPHKSLGYILRESILQDTSHMEKAAVSKRQKVLMQKVELPEEYLEKFAHQLSGGERQRFQIARALAVSPSVLICDESLEGLDLPVQLKIMEILNTLRREEGLALVFITHHLGVARRFADRMVIMHHGEIIEEGPVEKIFTHPETSFTKSLVEAEKQKQIAF